MALSTILPLFCARMSTARTATTVTSRTLSFQHACGSLTSSTTTPAFLSIIARNQHRMSTISCLNMVNNDEEETSPPSFEPTWEYVPYKQPPKPKRSPNARRRHFSTNSNWKVPSKVTIPMDQIDLTFNRSSGAGGQNVNKVNTRVEIRFHVMSASWIPLEVRERLTQQEGARVNKEGILSVYSQEHRTQGRNREECMDKLQEMVLKAYPRPKLRKLRTGRSQKGKERNMDNKKFLSKKKENRKRVDF